MTTARVTQVVVEVAQQNASAAQSSQLVLEVSTPFIGTAVPLGAISSQLVLEVSVAHGPAPPVIPPGTEGEQVLFGVIGGAQRLVGVTAGLEAAHGATR